MLDFEKGFKQQIHESWWEPMKPIIESKEVYDIYEYLKAESSRGIKITPKHDCVFKSFQVNLDELKVVVKGLDGYPQIYKGKHYANGRAFCCENYGKVSPSLEKLREGWIDDCKYTTYNKNNLSLKYLEDQGVMLTNATNQTLSMLILLSLTKFPWLAYRLCTTFSKPYRNGPPLYW